MVIERAPSRDDLVLLALPPPQDDVLVPPFDSALRVSSTWSATVNLLTTIVGGGILSLPFTFKACGLVVGLSTLVASGVASGLTMGWLIECARLTGANDFSAVAARAFASSGAAGGGGAAAELVVTLVVLTICVFTLLADSILIADTSSALLTAAIGPPADDDGGGTARRRDATLGVLLVLVVLPLLLQRSLHALRHAGLAGFLSACFLGLVLVVRAAQRILSSPPFTRSPYVDDDIDDGGDGETGDTALAPLALLPASWGDALAYAPLLVVCFVCHFNVIGVHASLERPTRARASGAVWLSIGGRCVRGTASRARAADVIVTATREDAVVTTTRPTDTRGGWRRAGPEAAFRPLAHDWRVPRTSLPPRTGRALLSSRPTHDI